MKNFNIILFTYFICAISISCFGGLWFVMFENINLLKGFAITFVYAIFSWPVFLLILTYHFSLVYLSKKKIITLSFIKKICVIILIGFIYFTLFYFVPNYSYPTLELIKFLMFWELLCIYTALFYELSLYLFKKWQWE